MLIVSQPKSASTSLARGIAAKLDMHYKQRDTLTDAVRPKLFDCLPHRCMINVSPDTLIKQSTSTGTLFKQHYPPSSPNLKVIDRNQLKIVLTVRRPEDTWKAYGRHRSLSNKHVRYKGMTREWLRSIRKWRKGWLSFAEDRDYILVVSFKSIVLEPHKTANRILRFWGMDEFSSFSLPKYRYSGFGKNKLQRKRGHGGTADALG